MAQNVTVAGASYEDVPSVTLTKTGGGTASFTDVTDTTATDSDVLSGAYFYTANGVRSVGVAQGLPTVTSSDNGKSLVVSNGAWNVALDGNFIASYGHSTYDEVLAMYQANKIMYCRASSNSNPSTGNQLRLAFLAYVNNQDTPTEFEFQYYRSVATHSATQQGDQVYVYKLKKTSGWEFSVREAYTKIAVGTGLTTSYSNGVLTISLSS